MPAPNGQKIHKPVCDSPNEGPWEGLTSLLLRPQTKDERPWDALLPLAEFNYNAHTH
jgi:hypothetical protein